MFLKTLSGCLRSLFPKREEGETLAALRRLESGGKCGINLGPYFIQFSRKPGWNIGHYWIEQECRPNGGPSEKFDHIYYDTKYAFVLVHNRTGIACVGFEFWAPEAIVVKQIQGVGGQGNILRQWRWERMLLKIVADWAQQNGFARVYVQPASQNNWKNSVDEQTLKLRYDITAQRQGFRFDPNFQMYVLNI